MDAVEARKLWQKTFGDEVDFDKVYNGKLKLTEKQISQLFDCSIQAHIDLSKRIYGAAWHNLRANEQIAIISSCFNGPKLVNRKTDFYDYLTEYATIVN